MTCLIQARKESLFWADSFSLAWRTINKFASDKKSSVDAIIKPGSTMLRAWTLAFLKPFLLILEKSRHHLAPAGSQECLQKVRISSYLSHLYIPAYSLSRLAAKSIGGIFAPSAFSRID